MKLEYIILIALAIFGCRAENNSNIKFLHEKYMAASINHDIETLCSMTHDENYLEIRTLHI
jgi:hypothetical protein